MGVDVAGVREIARGLEAAGVDVAGQDGMGSIATEAGGIVARLVPSRSGRLRASVRTSREKGRSVVTVGNAQVLYAPVIQYGWRRRNIRPARFAERTDAVMETRAAQLLEDEWNTIAERHGLT